MILYLMILYALCGVAMCAIINEEEDRTKVLYKGNKVLDSTLWIVFALAYLAGVVKGIWNSGKNS